MVDINVELPEQFLNEEVRNGYTVSREMKEVWAVELDLLAKLLEVCEKEKLKIFIDAGSLLGAVRHKGFIPWDDDIDLIMFREDYDKLIEKADQLFNAPYFLQSAYNDAGYIRGHAQFRNSQTTAILKSEENANIKFNEGVFLDVFVLDGVYDSRIKLKMQKIVAGIMEHFLQWSWPNEVNCKLSGNKMKVAIKKILLQVCGKDYLKWYRRRENLFRSNKVGNCRFVAPLMFKFETEKRIRDKHLYDETVWLDFENMKVPAPRGYDEYLKNRYGNYMKPAQIPTTHGGVIFDTDKSYLEYRQDRIK